MKLSAICIRLLPFVIVDVLLFLKCLFVGDRTSC